MIGQASALVAIIAVVFPSTLSAQQSTDDRIRLMNSARNVCNAIAKFVDTPDPGSEITYDQGRFKIVRSKTGATVFEDNVKIAEMQKFDYAGYQACLDRMVGDKK